MQGNGGERTATQTLLSDPARSLGCAPTRFMR